MAEVLLLRARPRDSVCSSVPPLGLGYLATALRRAGHGVRIVDLGNVRNRPPDLVRALTDRPPDLVGVQTYSREISGTRELLDLVRRRWTRPAAIVAGGPHPSIMPVEAFAHLPEIDFAVVGDGEGAIVDLARRADDAGAVDLASIPGLAFRDGDRIQVNRSVVPENLDDLGFPAWDVMRLDGYHTEALGGGFTRRPPAMTMLTSRGCPFQCGFCCSAKIYGRGQRLRSADAVLDEMHELHGKYGFNEIKFIDDNSNADRRHILRIGEAHRRRPVNVSVSFACGLHLNTLDDEVVATIRDLGAYEVMIAVETGSARIQRLMNKNLRLEEVIQKAAMIRRYGLKVVAFFLIGYPGETLADIRKTVALSLALPLDRAHFNCFSPYPGAPVYEQLAAAGALPPIDARHVHFETFNYSFVEGVSVKQLRRLRVAALARFYLRPRPFWGLLSAFRHWSSFKFLFTKTLEFLGWRY